MLEPKWLEPNPSWAARGPKRDSCPIENKIVGGPPRKNCGFRVAFVGHGALWGLFWAMVAFLLNTGGTMKHPCALRAARGSYPATQANSGSRGLEFKFCQLAPSLGDQKLHVPRCFLHVFSV